MHEPVLVEEVVALLEPRPDGVYVDATFGWGGHTRALLDAGAGRVIGIDRDRQAIGLGDSRFDDVRGRLEVVHDDYRRLPDVLRRFGLEEVTGMLADLGVSSMQLDSPERGFSFRQSGPLDMRMDASGGESLRDRLAAIDETTLADVIWRLGEERRSRRVARAIVFARDRGELTDTLALATVVRRAVGGGWQRIDPATRTFQALRIWVNDELGGLSTFLEVARTALQPKGRLAVIAFHSLEDRLVKHAFRDWAAGGGARLVTRRPVVASDAESARNPRARSARLRVVERAA